jgi:hypothetical protein
MHYLPLSDLNAEEPLSCFILKYGIDSQVDLGFTVELYSTVLLLKKFIEQIWCAVWFFTMQVLYVNCRAKGQQ